jgi:replication initiation and membrane attachment protein
MKMSSLMHFTENHRFTVFRDGTLGSLEVKMMTGAYQPMIGVVAAGLYSLLQQQLPADQSGYTPLEQQRKLFQSLDIEPNENGRKQLIGALSKLEAVGLLQSSQLENAQSEEYLYEYRLFAPLKPDEFFQTAHLVLLLRDKIGEHALESLRAGLVAEIPSELDDPYLIRKELSSPFYEVFTLSRAAATAHKESKWPGDGEQVHQAIHVRQLPEVRFSHSQIVARIPRSSLNRRYIERLEEHQNIIERLNYYADKYGLTLKELGQLLDEDAVFDMSGEWMEKEFERRAESLYLQRHKREEGVDWGLVEQLNQTQSESAAASATIAADVVEVGFDVPENLRDRFDAASYNRMLRSEPYTKVLQLFIAPTIMGTTKELFSKLSVLYRFPDEVLNALIHHMRVNQLPWNKTYIEKVASSLQGQQIADYGQAVAYFRREMEARQARERSKNQPAGERASRSSPARTSSGNRGTGSRGAGTGAKKPKLPVYRPSEPGKPLTAEEEAEFDRLLRQLETTD